MKSVLPLPLVALGILLAPVQFRCGAQDSSTSATGVSSISIDTLGSGKSFEKFEVPTVPFTGVVVDAMGTPVPSVAVHVVDGPGFLSMEENEFPRKLDFPIGQVRIAHTRENGEYSFALPPGNVTLFVGTETGCALMANKHTDNNPLRVTLQPWARMKITFAEPSTMAGRAVYLSADRSVEGAARQIERIYEGTLDDDGTFAFMQLIPGAYQIDRRKGALTGTGVYSNVLAGPGETLEIVIGGDGRPVVGRIQVPETVAAQVDWPLSVVRLHRATSNGQLTEKLGNGMEAGTTRTDTVIVNTYHTCVSEVRDFRLEDVKPGKYNLTIQLRELGVKAFSGGPSFVEELKQEIVVGPLTDGTSEVPENLGLFSMAE